MPIFVEYINGTWLSPHKEKFVKTRTGRVIHIGNKISNMYIRLNLYYCEIQLETKVH